MSKGKKTKEVNRKVRVRKAKPWVATYQGTDIVHDYGKKFKVDPICSVKDLEAMKASTPEQRELLKQAHEICLQRERDERTNRLVKKLEKRKIEFDKSELDPTGIKKLYKTVKADSVKKKNPKRRCENCGAVMKQALIGLKHCKCGTSWQKGVGYFQRSKDMVFALERKVIKKGKNSIRTKQVPIIRYKPQDETK